MNRTFLILLASVSVASFGGCASALKKKCESTNWFEYGESVARRGQRTSSDSFVLDCEKEEAEIDHPALSHGFQKGMDDYCNPEFAYRLGKQGEFLSSDFCAGGMELKMKPRHEQGVREYCQPSNGEAAGGAGKHYNQICPKELEAAFLPRFNQGRKKYLAGLIARREGEVADLDAEIRRLEERKRDQGRQLQRLQGERNVLLQLNPATANPASMPVNDPARAQMDRINIDFYDLQRKQRSLDGEIDSAATKQKALKQEIREAQGELPTL